MPTTFLTYASTTAFDFVTSFAIRDLRVSRLITLSHSILDKASAFAFDFLVYIVEPKIIIG